jgi:hypothetical protein
VGDDVRIESEFLFRRRLHAIQQAIGVQSRQDIKERSRRTSNLSKGSADGRDSR